MPARNISEYPQLLNAIHSAEKIVYLCGAGASMSIGSHRLSWTNWIAEGRKYLTIPEQNELNLKIGSWTAEELIDAATFLLGKLKSSGAYQTFMNQTIGALHPVNTEFKEALCKVWRAGDLIATTNYDTQIEETLNAKGVSYECPAEILSIIRSTAENKVIHLHGMYDERDGIDNIIADYVQGTNYLAEDCNRLISFFDARSGRPGADNLFEDLFVSVSEQEDDPAQPTLFELLYQQMDKEPQKAESGGSSKSLDQDEKFSLLAPYVKLSADPQEVYLNMRVRGGVATEEEKQKLIQLQNQRTQKEKMLPDHAWLMEPCFPDVINEYIVDYVVNVRDAERFAKLVKSNSVMGFAKFISLALDDWPESDVFQKIAITPPDEELNDSEYYLGLMSRISAIKDIAAVEDVLLEREPIFQRYELELWRRIAIVLTDRGDIRRLYNSGLKYIRFLKEISEKVTIRDEAVDAIEAYCVGLHNAEAVDEYGAFLKKCGELTQLLADNKRIAVICCQNYGRLMHLRLYKNVNAEIQEEWNAIVEILKQCNYDEDVYKNVLDAVEEYFRTLVQRKKEDKLFELERFMAQVYEENGRCEAAEVAALCLANLYNSGGHRKITPDEYETIKKYLQKFPESMHIRAAFIIASEAIYSPSAEYKRVPDKIINKAKQWSEQYPKKIEFQEAYFGLLFSRLKYAQAQDMRNEQRRVYREMKTVAERANYSEYNESNQLMESVDILHRVFGY